MRHYMQRKQRFQNLQGILLRSQQQNIQRKQKPFLMVTLDAEGKAT